MLILEVHGNRTLAEPRKQSEADRELAGQKNTCELGKENRSLDSFMIPGELQRPSVPQGGVVALVAEDLW
jgi:hypothetical protein